LISRTGQFVEAKWQSDHSSSAAMIGRWQSNPFPRPAKSSLWLAYSWKEWKFILRIEQNTENINMDALSWSKQKICMRSGTPIHRKLFEPNRERDCQYSNPIQRRLPDKLR
jgi:hypothetical protein